MTLKTLKSVLFRTLPREKCDNSSLMHQRISASWRTIFDLSFKVLSGYWALAVFVLIGHVECHITGPSIVISLIIALLTSLLSSLCQTELITHPRAAGRGGCSGNVIIAVYNLVGECPSFFLAWMTILFRMSLVGACARAITATIDKTLDNRFHDFIIHVFGLTPFLDTYPDFLAGGAAMITALFIAAGMEHSKTIQSCLNLMTSVAFFFIFVAGLIEAKAATYASQPFLLDGSRGVIVAVGVCSLALSGGTFETGVRAGNDLLLKSSLNLIPQSNFIYFGVVFFTCLTISITLPFVTELSPLGLVPEVPLLQAFEAEFGPGYIRFIVAALGISSMSFTLLELSIPLHKTVLRLADDGLLFRILTKRFSRTDTPFLGCAIVGSLTAVIATLCDVSRLLLIASVCRISSDLFVCTLALATRYGVRGIEVTGKESGLIDLKSILPSGIVRRTKRKSKGKRNAMDTARKLAKKRRGFSSLTNAETEEGRKEVEMPAANKSLKKAETPRKAPKRRILGLFFKKMSGHSQLKEEDIEEEGKRDERSRNNRIDLNIPLDDANIINLRNDVETGSLEQREETSSEISSPSGYETDSSNDTDIDTVVEEYNSISTISRPSERPRSHDEFRTFYRSIKNEKISSLRTLYGIFLLFVIFTIQSLTLSFLTASEGPTKNPSGAINAIILDVWASLTSFALLMVIAKQPQARDSKSPSQCRVPCTPWLQALAIFLHMSVLMRLLSVEWVNILLWMLLGFFIYIFYGIQHSALASVKRRTNHHFRPSGADISSPNLEAPSLSTTPISTTNS